jgi:DNA-binding beta-propeller fold protein YncE
MSWLDRFCGPRETTDRISGLGSLSEITDFPGNDRSAATSVKTILAAGGLLLLAGTIGCGNMYRPTVTPINPTGPSAQPTAELVVVSQPGMVGGAIVPSACPTPTNPQTQYADPGVTTVVDFSGDAVMAQAQIGYGPLTFAIASGGATAFSPNVDCSLSNIPASTGLQTRNVATSTLLTGEIPVNMLTGSTSTFVVQRGFTSGSTTGTDSIAQMTGSPLSLKQTIAVDPTPINVIGAAATQRVYVISQGSPTANPGWGACDTPTSVGTIGTADAIDTSTNTRTGQLPLGICPVYGLMTPNTLRAFVMNRGSGTVTVINAQLNAIDTVNNLATGGGMNGSGSICLSPVNTDGSCPTGAGPLYADFYAAGNILAVANYDAGTVSFIDTSTDIYGNDSPTFGKIVGTVAVDPHPIALTILQDGSRVYVACEGSSNTSSAGTAPGTVDIINMSSYSVQKVIDLSSNPDTSINPRSIVSIYNFPIGKVYVSSQGSANLVIIRTDTDTLDTTVGIQGPIVDIHVSSPYPGESAPSAINNSRSVGSGMP